MKCGRTGVHFLPNFYHSTARTRNENFVQYTCTCKVQHFQMQGETEETVALDPWTAPKQKVGPLTKQTATSNGSEQKLLSAHSQHKSHILQYIVHDVVTYMYTECQLHKKSQHSERSHGTVLVASVVSKATCAYIYIVR